MKKLLGFLFTMVLMLGFLMLPTVSGALTIGDVGGTDILIWQEELANSGNATELNWINDHTIPGTYTSLLKRNTPSEGAWLPITDVANTYAFYVPELPEYFLVKTGNLGVTDDSEHFLFENTGNLDYAVINLFSMGFQQKDLENFGKLSHISTVGGTPVPEPVTMLLFGSGLVGLSVLRRKYK